MSGLYTMLAALSAVAAVLVLMVAGVRRCVAHPHDMGWNDDEQRGFRRGFGTMALVAGLAGAAVLFGYTAKVLQ